MIESLQHKIVRNLAAGAEMSRFGGPWQATKCRNAHFTQWERIFVKREVDTHMANIIHRCLTFVFFTGSEFIGGSPKAKVPPRKTIVFPWNQNGSWMHCPCSVSSSASRDNEGPCGICYQLPGVFTLAHGSHFVCNLGVPMHSRWALSLLPCFPPPSLLYSFSPSFLIPPYAWPPLPSSLS